MIRLVPFLLAFIGDFYLDEPAWRWHFGRASIFWGDGTDTGNPNPTLACDYPRKLDDDADECVALPARIAPCNAPVVIVHLVPGFPSLLTRVCDRGPRSRAIDMTKLAAKRLRFRGDGWVVFGVRRW